MNLFMPKNEMYFYNSAFYIITVRAGVLMLIAV